MIFDRVLLKLFEWYASLKQRDFIVSQFLYFCIFSPNTNWIYLQHMVL